LHARLHLCAATAFCTTTAGMSAKLVEIGKLVPVS